MSSLWGSSFGHADGAALLATGGYGRGELSPHSDADLLILLDGRKPGDTPVRALLYPLWDAGWTVGHAVRSPKEALDFARGDLHAAASLLTVRFVAGDNALFEAFESRKRRWRERMATRLSRRILEADAQRRGRVDRAGWTLAPDLKEGVGGLRDVHCVQWLGTLNGSVPLSHEVRAAYELLMATREALHGQVRRKSDTLHIDLQPAVARALGLEGETAADELMASVHPAARTIEHGTLLAIEEVSERVTGGPRRSGQTVALEGGVRLTDGRLHADESVVDPGAALQVAVAFAATSKPLARRTLAWMNRCFAVRDWSWDERARGSFIALLSAPHAVRALELLDNVDAWDALLPQWLRVRGKAQHDPYHRYTVDGHSFLCVNEVTSSLASDPRLAAVARDAGSLDELYLGALLHDVGKGSGGDHSVAGERIARRACEHMGFGEDTAVEVAMLVRHHLLLPEVAIRRDVDDGSVIATVAATVKSPRSLRLLYLLGVADGIATSPQAWSQWKASLVTALFNRTLVALETGTLPTRSDVEQRAAEVEAYEPLLAGRAARVLETMPPSYVDSTPVADMADELKLLAAPPAPGEVRCHVDPGTESGQAVFTLCAHDRPGTLARAAGVLSLHRIAVLSARAFASDDGLALTRFVVADPRDESRWEGVRNDLGRAFAGRLALEARLRRKAGDYRPSKAIAPDVTVLHDASPHSTVIEVRCRDALGILYAIAAALTELDLDIHVATIDTLGERVVDVFYVRSIWGPPLDESHDEEIVRAIEHRIESLLR